MATRPSLPYFAPAERLPAPLPTTAEVLAAEATILNSGKFKPRAVRVGDHYAVKYGGPKIIQEGENMLFIKQSTTTVPIPEVYALFKDEATGFSFLVMEYIHGENLQSVWRRLDTTKKRAIASQLRQGMDELRSIPPPGYYGGIWRQHVQDFSFWESCYDVDFNSPNPYFNPKKYGPFETEEQWVDGMVMCVQGVLPKAALVPRLRQAYHDVFKGHPPVFTHSDISDRNIKLRDDGTAVLINWETAGWYPSSWEYCIAALRAEWHGPDGLQPSLPEILDEYPAELALMKHHNCLVLMHMAPPPLLELLEGSTEQA